MESFYLWPETPMLSIFVLWVGSTVFLWAARKPMLKLVSRLGGDFCSGFESAGKRVAQAATEFQDRNSRSLLAAGMCQAQGRLDPELQRMDAGFSEQMRK